MAPKRIKAMDKAKWDEMAAKHPPGLYCVYNAEGREREVMIRGYVETTCGDVAILFIDPHDIKAHGFICLKCHPDLRLEMVQALQ